MKNSFLLSCLLLMMGDILGVCHAISSPDDTIKPYISSSFLYDSNFLRIADNAPNKSDSSEFIKQVKVGFDADWKLSRQHLIINANANQNWFQNFSTLDYTGWNTRATFDWNIRSNFDGEMSYSNVQALGSFNQLNRLTNNIINNQRFYANVGYLFHPNGKFKVEVFRNDMSFNTSSRQINNNIEDNISGTLQYLSPYGSTFGALVLATNGKYPNRTNSLGNSYTRMHYELNWNWIASSKTAIKGSVGYTQQNYADLSERNFEQPVGALELNWQVSDKTLLNLLFSRRVRQYNSQIASFLLTHGVYFNPTWNVSPKISILLPMSYQLQDYLGFTATNIIGTEKRKDNVSDIGLKFIYKPLDNINATTVVNYQNRDSNAPFRSYNSLSAGINLEVDF